MFLHLTAYLGFAAAFLAGWYVKDYRLGLLSAFLFYALFARIQIAADDVEGRLKAYLEKKRGLPPGS